MKRTIGWMLALTVAAPACAQQPPAAPVAPKVPPAPAAATFTPAKGVVMFKDGITEPGDILEIDAMTQPSAGRGWGGGGGTLVLTSDGKNVTLHRQQDDAAANQIRSLEGYLSAVGQYSRSNNDATTTAIAAVMQAAEILRPKGADAQIGYFTKVMEKTENENVRRAIRLQLIDAYKRAGQTDKALDELKTIILDAPQRAR